MYLKNKCLVLGKIYRCGALNLGATESRPFDNDFKRCPQNIGR